MYCDRSLLKNFKSKIGDFIEFYYSLDGNGTGGNLHILLDDGNVRESDLYFCYDEAEQNNDLFGQFICSVLALYSEDERVNLFNNKWKLPQNKFPLSDLSELFEVYKSEITLEDVDDGTGEPIYALTFNNLKKLIEAIGV